MKTNASEWLIQRAVYHKHLSAAAVIVPNVYAYRWESDLLIVTKAGYVKEVEVKISKADFMADSRKQVSRETTKYEAITSGVRTYCDKPKDCKRPNRFYYAFPRDMVPLADVPEWAGVYHWLPNGAIVEARYAPRLHEQKAEPKFIDRLYKSAYHRYMQWWSSKDQPLLPAQPLDNPVKQDIVTP